jgi:hypothetical protein
MLGGGDAVAGEGRVPLGDALAASPPPSLSGPDARAERLPNARPGAAEVLGVRSPSELPHQLDGLLQVLDAVRRSRERASHVVSSRTASAPSTQGSVPGGAGVSGRTASRSLCRCWRSLTTSWSGREVPHETQRTWTAERSRSA